MSVYSDDFSSAFGDVTSSSNSSSNFLFEDEYEGIVELGGTAYRCQIDLSSDSTWGRIWLQDLRSQRKWYVRAA